MNTNMQKDVNEIMPVVMDKIDRVLDLLENRTEEKRWYGPVEAAKYLDVSKSHLMGNLKKEINHSKRLRRIVFDKVDLDEFWIKRKVNKSTGVVHRRTGS